MKKYIFAAILAVAVLALIAPQYAKAAEGDQKFTVHGEVRFRGDYTDNADDFDDDGTFDDQGLFFPYRVRLAAEGKFSKNVSAWVEFQNAGVAGGDAVGTDPFRAGFDLFGAQGNGVELYQGNMTLDELWSKNFSLRIGRQEITAGNELLLGDLDFYNGITHDGGVGMWDLDNVDVMIWYTRPHDNVLAIEGAGFAPPGSLGTFSSGENVHFAGGYATWTFDKDQMFDVYLMNLNGFGMNVQTVGARYAYDVMNRDGMFWDIELATQFGDADVDVDASGMAGEGWFGYNWKRGANTHRVYVRAEYATGDDATTTDEDEGFLSLFGDFHNRTGRGDWFQVASDSSLVSGGIGGDGGLVALSVGYNGFYNDRHEFGAAYWDYTLEEDNGGEDALGTAFDIWYGFNYSRNVNFTVSVSQLSPDDALTGGSPSPDDSVMRIYGQARLRF
jgi:hypothetical protein